jgi:hypothetical protein
MKSSVLHSSKPPLRIHSRPALGALAQSLRSSLRRPPALFLPHAHAAGVPFASNRTETSGRARVFATTQSQTSDTQAQDLADYIIIGSGNKKLYDELHTFII